MFPQNVNAPNTPYGYGSLNSYTLSAPYQPINKGRAGGNTLPTIVIIVAVGLIIGILTALFQQEVQQMQVHMKPPRVIRFLREKPYLIFCQSPFQKIQAKHMYGIKMEHFRWVQLQISDRSVLVIHTPLPQVNRSIP